MDALTAQLPASDAGTLVIVQHRQSYRYFTAAQRQRLRALMVHWKTARETGGALPADEQAELEALVHAVLAVAGQRAASLAEAVER